jgi:hypothetical protein
VDSWYKVTLKNDLRCHHFLKACEAKFKTTGAGVYAGATQTPRERVFFFTPSAVRIAKSFIAGYGGIPCVGTSEHDAGLRRCNFDWRIGQRLRHTNWAAAPLKQYRSLSFSESYSIS